MDAQATVEAFSLQKRTSSTSNHEHPLLFSIFVGHFCPATQINADPCGFVSGSTTLVVVLSFCEG
jgi:hypothetical protein